MANEQPAGYVCDGCGRLTRDLEQDMHKLKEGNFLSCCPERKMLPVYTRPAAPVEGLETVGYRYRHVDYVNWTYSESKYPRPDIRNEELVTRSQAKTIIAAERNRAEVAEYKLDQAVNTVQPMIIQRAERAEADNAALTSKAKGVEDYIKGLIDDRNVAQEDNAALTARVKELGDVNNNQDEMLQFLREDHKALETQLAAARREIKRLVLKEGGVEEECP